MDILPKLPVDSIDVAVTSPPYWSLRDYGEVTVKVWGGSNDCDHEWGKKKIDIKYSGGITKEYVGQFAFDKTHFESSSCFCRLCGAWRGQLGLEPHPQLYIDHLVSIFRLLKGPLKPRGSFWLNMGDTYCGGGTPHGKWKESGKHRLKKGEYMSDIEPQAASHLKMDNGWLQPKQRLMLPYRVAMALQMDGWILRNIVVWMKPNAMPSSVKDRLSNRYEPVFFFVQQRRYYFDLDAIREQPKTNLPQKSTGTFHNHKEDLIVGQRIKEKTNNPKGKNPGDVWRISTKPFKDAHFATFPPELVKRILSCACPQRICQQCGKPRTRMVKCHRPKDYTPSIIDERMRLHGRSSGQDNYRNKPITKMFKDTLGSSRETIGWSDCGCQAGWRSGVVLDPFIGAGTTGLVAKQMGLNYVGIELNPEYVKMAEQRINVIPSKLETFIPNLTAPTLTDYSM